MKTKTLDEITTKIGSGATPRGGQNAYQEEGISLIRSQNVYDFSFSKGGLAFITDEQAKKLNNVTVEKGDVLLNITGDSIARTCIVPDEILPARVNQHVSIIRCKKGYDSRFVNYYLINLKPYLLQICGVGGTRNALTKEALQNLEIKIPSNQKQIAKVLSDLDAKIEVNNKINQELEAMAKLIYDYWFVQFDFPFDFAQGKPDPNGKPYKSSGGKMVYNKELKREIPEGWEVGTLLDIANYQNGIACQKFRPIDETYLPVIKIKEMRDGYTDKTEKVRLDVPDRVKIFDGDVLFSWSASLEVIIWSGGKGALNQHIFKVTSDNYPKSYYYFELLNYLQHFKMIADLRKTTMGHITQDHLKQSRISIPPYDLCFRLEEKIGPILKSIVSNRQQNQKLSELRDWLLPMLMNGQVTVANDELGITNAELGNDLGMVAEETQEYKYTK
tara:strand:- start:1738 stop:3072 length:1335 start_codon:yes stop_codon:yes gene_type:complete